MTLNNFMIILCLLPIENIVENVKFDSHQNIRKSSRIWFDFYKILARDDKYVNFRKPTHNHMQTRACRIRN